MKIIRKQKNKGFTLVEMLVAVALFSIVLVIALGSIITIIDTNRKSQSLTLVMNNLNFALESMTRTIKTSRSIDVGTEGNLLFEEQIDKDDSGSGTSGYYVTYRENEGTLERCKKTNTSSCSDSEFIPIISSDVQINNFRMIQLDDQQQWRILMVIDGVVQMSPKISSEFHIQTTVSPRNLQI